MRSQVLIIMFFISQVCLAQWNTDSTLNTLVCKVTGDQKYPELVSDGAGGAIIVWEDGREANTRIYAQRIDSSGTAKWTPNGIIISDAENSMQPKITSDGSGGAIITWFDRRVAWPNSAVAIQRVNADGDTLWQANGVVLTNSANSWSYPVITGYPNDGAVTTWIGADGEILAQKVDSSGTVQWKEGGVLIDLSGSVPQIIGDKEGGAIICWNAYDSEAQYTNVFAQRVNVNGEIMWTTTGDTICTAPGYQHSPELVPDGEGGAIVGWLDSRTQNNMSYAYAQKVSSSGTKYWDKDGIKISDINGYSRIRIASNGSGGAIITWLGPDSDVFVQGVAGDGTRLWSEEVRLTIESEYGNPRIIADGLGGAFISLKHANSLILQHLNAEGILSFASEGRVISTGEYGKDFQTLCADDKGNAYIAWEDMRPIYTTDIYAHKISLYGSVTGVQGEDEITPGKFSLSQNYPNPFNPSTRIEYSVPQAARVIIKIFSALGEEIETLVNEEKISGRYNVNWNAFSLPSGIYFYRIQAGNFMDTKKMILIK